jgi:soluble lytic murein transglycosylase-like protein
MILVWDLGPPLGAEVAPMLSPSLQSGMDLVETKWGDLCREIGARHQLPDGWLQAMIWRESAGNPRAFRQEKNADGTNRMVNGRSLTGVGLMQITSPALKGRRTDAELFDPGINIELGAGYISSLASRPDTKGADGKPDFARISAAFNAGSVRDSSRNRWGFVQTTGHVDAEVSAYNYWLTTKMNDANKAAAMAIAAQFSLIDLLPDMGAVDLPDDDDSSA